MAPFVVMRVAKLLSLALYRFSQQSCKSSGSFREWRDDLLAPLPRAEGIVQSRSRSTFGLG